MAARQIVSFLHTPPRVVVVVPCVTDLWESSLSCNMTRPERLPAGYSSQITGSAGLREDNKIKKGSTVDSWLWDEIQKQFSSFSFFFFFFLNVYMIVRFPSEGRAPR